MTVQRFQPMNLARPSGFSHVTRFRDLVFLAGQTALDSDGVIVEGGVVAQFRQALANVLTALEAAGGRPENLLAMTIYLMDVHDYQLHGAEIGQVWKALVGPVYPAMAGVGVTALWQPTALVEIQAVAALDGDG